MHQHHDGPGASRVSEPDPTLPDDAVRPRHAHKEPEGFDLVGFCINWENGDLSEDETAAGFQHLIDTGLAWQLQGMYGREAKRLIQAGLCHERA